jgi:hypothetical protein
MGVPRKGQKKSETAKAAKAEKTTETKSAATKAEIVSEAIRSIEEKLKADKLKPTMGDFIRLLQLEKQLEDEQPTEIKVSWVEPDEKEHVSEE